MQLLELWQIAKLVLKQSVKVHGSLVRNLGLMMRDRRKHFEWQQQLIGER